MVVSTLPYQDLLAGDRGRLLDEAQACLHEEPVTITAYPAACSPGTRHDYYSEADYWWPAPRDPQGPYVRRDGHSNPHAFARHRQAMRRLSVHVPRLAMAYLLTDDPRYADHVARHLHAWFVAPDTRMNPNLAYAQAIPGRVTGRGIGIIDTLHLAEVARAVRVLADVGALPSAILGPTRDWFRSYTDWLNTHPHGQSERDEPNNHGTAWLLQVAAFADLLHNTALLAACRQRYRSVIVPGQIAPNGSLPLELDRTKPYAYSLFNLDLLATLCQLLSTSDDDLWAFETSDGRGMRRTMAFMYPYIEDKATWPRKPDVMHHDRWPVRHPSLLFAGHAYGRTEYLALWRRLDPSPTHEEVVRNYPVRQPFLWIEHDADLHVAPTAQSARRLPRS